MHETGQDSPTGSAEGGNGDNRPENWPRIAFVAADSEEAQQALKELEKRYPHVPEEEADVIVALGGDGLILHTMHRILGTRKAIFGMNRGSVGFLMNDYSPDNLLERLRRAEVTEIHPLRMLAEDVQGNDHQALAFNEVSLFRQTHQAAKLRIIIDGKVRMEELICDGIIIATPAGSTAYNLSAHGPILPIGAPLLALTPISPFRPRRWKGAILPKEAHVRIEVLEAKKRPVAAVADNREYRNIAWVEVEQDESVSARLMFDPGHSLAERIINEQFVY
ncbi:NAD kinase [Thermopetrobacter sp. TC1]|uniref:NAD kinase n=1 Tax=Thermopetrobacter sp. TC1 TaxID=1495045 RepID=UPI000A789291|nr:NAD kinase [Thermopetrobacter sp. TC1]